MHTVVEKSNKISDDNYRMSYPDHEFSKYIDNEFSFSNNVSDMNMGSNRVNVNRIPNIMCEGNIMLEPRLQEYIRKKKYYKENNIQPVIRLEKEFSITEHDKKVIKNFLRGKKDMYKTENLEINNTKSVKKNYFPSRKFRKDERLEKFKNKERFDQPKNLGMFAPEDGEDFYDYDTVEDNDFFDSRDFDDSRFDPRVDPRMRPGRRDLDPDRSPYNVNGQVGDRLYNDGGRFNGNEVLFNQMLDKDVLAAAPNRYRSRAGNPVHNESLQWNKKDRKRNNEAVYGFSRQSKLDEDNKTFYPSLNSREPLDYSDYMAVPFAGHGKGACDVNLETEMLHGIPSRASKSYGYRNPEEHYYDYVDPDFQNEQNSASLPYHGFGFPTRLQNKRRRNRYEREIY